MIYSMDEIKNRIEPIAAKYELSAVYIFGSYARNAATDDSDVDIMIDRKNSKVKGMMMGGLYSDLSECLDKGIDLITINTLENQGAQQRSPYFIESIRKEAVKII